jgi:hypothetical protein
MKASRPRTLADRVEGVIRQIEALTRDPSEWDPSDLAVFGRLGGAVEHGFDQAVCALRDHGATDAQIAEALNITRQAVSKRWPGGGRYVGAAGRYRKPADSGSPE